MSEPIKPMSAEEAAKTDLDCLHRDFVNTECSYEESDAFTRAIAYAKRLEIERDDAEIRFRLRGRVIGFREKERDALQTKLTAKTELWEAAEKREGELREALMESLKSGDDMGDIKKYKHLLYANSITEKENEHGNTE